MPRPSPSDRAFRTPSRARSGRRLARPLRVRPPRSPWHSSPGRPWRRVVARGRERSRCRIQGRSGGRAPRQVAAGPEWLVSVLRLTFAFLRQGSAAIEAFATTGDDGPGDAIADVHRLTRRVVSRGRRTERRDPSQHLMPENRRDRDRPAAMQAVQVAAAQRAGDDLDEDFRVLRHRQGELAELQRQSRSVEDGSDAWSCSQRGLVWFERPRHSPGGEV